MIRKLLLLILFLSLSQVKGQEEDTATYGVLPSDIPTHNLVKYNRFYFNPTFSLVRENKKSINAYNKIQWAGFNDNPQTFLVNYTSNFDEKIGVSIGLHQQNEGIYRYFGGIANFAYNLQLDNDMNFTFGLNLGFSQSGLKSNIDSATSTLLNNGVQITDPVILNYENSSVFQLTPGVNFNYAEFDVGVSVVNLAAYNLSASELLTDNMAFTGHVMYTTSLQRRSDKTIRGMAYANMLTNADDAESDSSLRYGGNVIVELPELGWAQAGYNSFYGASVGIGGNITENVSVGYTYEMGLGDTGDFGSTHEVGLAYNFATEKPRRRGAPKTSSQKAYEARDSEIRRLKKEILEQNKLIRELQEGGGEVESQQQRAMSDLERSIAEAKEKEAKAASDLELKREEEVKLLNKQAEELAAQKDLERQEAEQQAEEERLAAQRQLEREEAEQKAEEERLAAQKDLEREVTEEETEESRIAAEEAEREAEAAKQQEEEERLAAQKDLERQVEQQQEEDDRQTQDLIEQTRQVIASGDLAALRNQAQIVQASNILPQAQMQGLLGELNTAIQAKEDAAAQLAEDQRQAEELRTQTREIIASGDLAALRNQAQIIQASNALPQAELNTLMAELNTVIQTKEEEEQRLAAQRELEREVAVQKAEEEKLARVQQLTRTTQEIITTGDVNELRNQLQIVQGSAILPQAEQQSLLAELNAAIQSKEAAAEELARVQELTRTTREVITSGDLAALQNQLQIVQGSTILPQAEQQSLLAELNAAIQSKEAAAEELARVQELTRTTREVITSGDLSALQNQLQIVQGSTILPQAEQQSLLAELNAAIQSKEAAAEELARVQELTRTTREVIASGDLAALQNQLQIVQGSDILPQAEQQSLLGELNAAIQSKEAAEAEAARQAEEQRQVQDLITQTRQVISDGDLAALRNQIQTVQASTILPQADKQSLTTELNQAIQAKEAAEAEAARQAEEQRQVQDLITQTRQVIATGDVDALRNQAQIVQASTILPQADKQSLTTELNQAIQAKEDAAAEAARLAEEERKRQEAAAAAAVPAENEEGLDEIKKELDNNARVSNKIFARRDSLLTASLNVDKRGFNQLLESLINMNDDATEAKSADPVSSKRLTANNRFVKFADATRPEAQYATKFIPGYPEGYYLIGNVFKGGTYADKFSSTLKDLGFNDSQIIINPENDFQYVAIESYTDKDEAARKYLSNIDNRYFGEMWILHIAKSRVESFKRLLQETKLITDTVKDDTVLTESLSYIGGHNIENGYYLITNIFKRENYFERGMAKLRDQGLEPQYFRNPKDNYIYVYLKRFDNLDEAKQSLFSNVNNSYSGDLYILKVQ